MLFRLSDSVGLRPPRGTSSVPLSNFRGMKMRRRLFGPEKCAPDVWFHHRRKATSSQSTLPCDLPADFYDVFWASVLINGGFHFLPELRCYFNVCFGKTSPHGHVVGLSDISKMQSIYGIIQNICCSL